MASPQLKKPTLVTPTRRLINSGVVPKTQVRLKGINGQTIKPKPAAPAKKGEAASAPADEEKKPLPVEETPAAEPAPEPTSVEETPAAEPAPEPTPAEETPAAEPAPEPTPAEETPAAESAPEPTPVEETPAPEPAPELTPEQVAAEEEARRAQEEYERQMEEYNRQLEEYNRQMASYEAAQAAAAQTAAQEERPAEAPAESTAASPKSASVKLSAAKPLVAKGPAKSGAALGKKAPAPVAAPAVGEPSELPEPSVAESEADAAPALQEPEAPVVPIWKSKLFYVACAALLVFAVFCGSLIVKANRENAARAERNERVMKVLRRAHEINKQGVETLAEAKSKGIDVSCTMEEANFLMGVIENPYAKDDDGKPLYGGAPESVAQLACLLVGIASEQSDDISKMVFDRLDKNASVIRPPLYRWLVQRLAVANIKGINSKLRKLADAVAKKDDKKFPKRGEVLAYIWEAMGLRVTEKDVPALIELIKDPSVGGMLLNAIANCLDNVVLMEEDPAKKAALGDMIFESLNDATRPVMASTLASSCSPKALSFYKQRAVDPANWRSDRSFFANYGSDDILPFLLELKNTAAGNAKNEAAVQAMINGVVSQNRDRSVEDARRMMSMVYDKMDLDTTAWVEINEKTDPGSAEYVGEDSPEYEALMKMRADLETGRKQKLTLINQLSSMYDYAWVTQYLEAFTKENDPEISSAARHALDKTKKNRANDEELRSKYKARDKG